MSDEQDTGSFIKSPRQLVWVVFLAFALPVVIVSLLLKISSVTTRTAPGSEVSRADSIEARIRPVANFELGAAETGDKPARSGEDLYNAQCAACHGTGVAGAPKFGDKDQWASHIQLGLETLIHSAVNGKGAMPPQSGTATEFEISRAVVYMANAAGASFDEPAAEEAPAAGEDKAEAPKEEPAKAEAEAPKEEPAKAEAPKEEPGKAAEAKDEPKEQAAAESAAPAAAAAADVDLAAGKKLYDTVCMVCHSTGVAGAPKVGDKKAWAPLIASGMDEMVKIAIHGKGAMPPRGGSSASDEDIHAAVAYMVSKSE